MRRQMLPYKQCPDVERDSLCSVDRDSSRRGLRERMNECKPMLIGSDYDDEHRREATEHEHESLCIV